MFTELYTKQLAGYASTTKMNEMKQHTSLAYR